LHEQNGNRSGAKAYLVNAHRLLARMRPADDEAVFRSSRRLGQICNELGHTEEAIDFFEQAVAAAPQVPGLPFSDLGALLNNVALMCRKAGRGTAAEPYYVRALQIYESQLGPEHPDVASVLNNLGARHSRESISCQPPRHRPIEMQSRGRLSFAGRLRAGFRTLSRFTPGLGGSDGQAARGIRSRGGELRRSSPFTREGP
jgi:tetratricopeptide (TPR) repeat protein